MTGQQVLPFNQVNENEFVATEIFEDFNRNRHLFHKTKPKLPIGNTATNNIEGHASNVMSATNNSSHYSQTKKSDADQPQSKGSNSGQEQTNKGDKSLCSQDVIVLNTSSESNAVVSSGESISILKKQKLQ